MSVLCFGSCPLILRFDVIPSVKGRVPEYAAFSRININPAVGDVICSRVFFLAVECT